ncbi:MAG: hypothetical protein ACM3MJ_04015 [Deltaproteobacteria bacterium]
MSRQADTGPGQAGAAVTAAPAKGLFFVRRVTAMRDFELFLVSSVATILLVRSILAATGWPQLGGGKIHFAHLLWGGVGMLLAFILFMAMQGRLWDFLATLSAGIGFGLFLDELGKFITSDNDYFFQPAVAIMYVLFVVLFFVFRWLGRFDKMGPETALVNSFDFAKEAVMRAMDRGERDEALYVLGRADQSDPMVQALTVVLRDVPAPETPNAAVRLWNRVHAWWERLTTGRAFRRFVLGWFVVTSVAQLLGLLVLDAAPGKTNLMDVGGVLAGVATGALVIVGLVRWRSSKLSAFRWFERGALVAILVGQFFSFYHDQVAAIVGLLWLLVQLAVIRSMISTEVANTAVRLQEASSGGAHGARQV